MTIKLETEQDKKKLLDKLLQLNCKDNLTTLNRILKIEPFVLITYYPENNTWSWSNEESTIKIYNLKVITLEEFLNHKKE